MDYPFTPEQICFFRLATTSWRRRAIARRHGLQFSEEFITETILMDLAEHFPGDVLIVPFNKAQEGKNGADWAWVFEDASRSWNIPMLVQAKALDLRERHYSGIKRYVGRTKTSGRQIDLLINTANGFGWPSIYAFYNHLSDRARIPNNCGSFDSATMPECWGISVADSYRVRAALNNQSFDRHRGHSLPLHCLLCSYGRGNRSPWGSPGLALRTLHRLRAGAEEAPALPEEAPALPTEPFRELPNLFHRAREIALIQDPRSRELLRRSLANEYPSLAGIMLLRDAAARS